MNKTSKKITIVIVTAIFAVGLGIVTFLNGPKIIHIISDFTGSGQHNGLTVLNSVTNINFDEDSKTLHFDIVEGVKEYEIKMKNVNLNAEYTYAAPVGSVQVDYPTNSLTGHTLNFSVVSKGDYISTNDSEPAVYNYTLQHETERLYKFFTEDFYRTVSSCVNSTVWGGDVKLDSIDSINFKDNNFYVKGNAKNYRDKDFNFTMTTVPYSTPTNFVSISILGTINASLGYSRTTTTTYTAGMVDVTSGLLAGQSETFKQYTDQGYYINTLQQTNTNFTNLGNGSRSFTVNGVYQAISQGDEKITFEANHTVTMQDNAEFTTPVQYFDYFNETGDATISNGEVTIYNADLMHHLEIMQQVHEEQVNKPSQESGFEL